MPFRHPEYEALFYDDSGNELSKEEIEDFNQYDGYADWFMNNQNIACDPDAFILFHGGETPVVFPSAYKNNPNKFRDFGDGFYTTEDVEQAERWAVRKLRETGSGAVSVYEYTGDLNGLIFPITPTLEWLDFVAQNRKRKVRYEEYNIVEGPVADDDVATTVNQYIAEEISAQVALEQIAYQSESHQMTFTSEYSTPHLRFLGWWAK